MDDPRAQDDKGAHLEEVGNLNGIEEREQADAHWDADMPVADLRAHHDVLPADTRVIQREEGIGHDHQQAAEPAQLGKAQIRAIVSRDPLHKMVDREVDAVGAGTEQQDVDQERPVERLVLADVVLEHFEHVQHLPEQEQADQHQAVIEVQHPVLGQGPERAGEHEQCDQGEQQIELVDAMEFRVQPGLALRDAFLHHGRRTKNGGQTEDQRQVGGVVDETVLDNQSAIAGRAAHDIGEHEIRESGAVRHDQRAEDGTFEALALHRMQAPDHHQTCRHEHDKKYQWMDQESPDGFD